MLQFSLHKTWSWVDLGLLLGIFPAYGEFGCCSIRLREPQKYNYHMSAPCLSNYMKHDMYKGPLRIYQGAPKACQASCPHLTPEHRICRILWVWMYSVECWIYPDRTCSTHTLNVATPCNALTYHPHNMQHNMTHRAYRTHALIALMSWNEIANHPYSMHHEMTYRSYHDEKCICL